jgi:dTDP-4-amino-4,6-dideoxygalactose transaminase
MARKITKRTKAILPVHFACRACDMGALMKLARTHRLRVVEDCAHALETEYRGKKAGTLGDLGCFSFYATKNLTIGEGGMVIGRKSEARFRFQIKWEPRFPFQTKWEARGLNGPSTPPNSGAIRAAPP